MKYIDDYDCCYDGESYCFIKSRPTHIMEEVVYKWYRDRLLTSLRETAAREEEERQRQVAAFVDPFEAASRV